MRGLRAEPEPEHDRDVGEQREGVPVSDRLAQPSDAIALGIERGDRLRNERPNERRTDDERQQRRGETRSEATSDGSEHDPEAEERAVRDRLVERVPTPVADDRPTHRHADPQRERNRRADQQDPRAAHAGNGSPTERNDHERGRQRHHRDATDREDPTDVRPVAGEHGAKQNRSDEPGERTARSRSRTPGRRAPTPNPWRATLAAGSVCPGRTAGYDTVASNKSFTLRTPPAHPASEDSQARASGRPDEISLLTTPRLLRTFVAVLALALSAVAALSTASPASAATECGKKVLADWFDNGRIDRLYPLNCYEEAIDAIPDDLRDYADAEDVITRALQAALRGDLAPGGRDPTPGDDDPTDPGNGNGSGERNGSGGSGDEGGNPQAAPDVDTSGPSSVPIPLLVLGGMSIALLAAGGLGYLSRRRAAAHADDPDDPETLV